MAIPGFTADMALRPSIRAYNARAGSARIGATSAVVPQQGASQYLGQVCWHGLMLEVYSEEGHLYGVWVGSCSDFP
jgi:hypothetical protein